MKILITFAPLLLFLSCAHQPQNQKSIDVKELNSISGVESMLTYIDNDSIFNQSFNCISHFNDQQLAWNIKIEEKGKLQKVISDSIRGKSYLVKAVDLNNDSIGELVFVTAEFFKAIENIETIKCEISCYAKKNTNWIRLEAPELTGLQKKGYFGNEVVSIVNNQIVRRYPVYTDKFKETGKQLLINYSLNKNLEWIVKTKEGIAPKDR